MSALVCAAACSAMRSTTAWTPHSTTQNPAALGDFMVPLSARVMTARYVQKPVSSRSVVSPAWSHDTVPSEYVAVLGDVPSRRLLELYGVGVTVRHRKRHGIAVRGRRPEVKLPHDVRLAEGRMTGQTITATSRTSSQSSSVSLSHMVTVERLVPLALRHVGGLMPQAVGQQVVSHSREE